MGAGFCLGVLVCFFLVKSGTWFFSKKIKTAADQALYTNSNQFMQLADKYFSTYVREARKDFDIKGGEILQTLNPVKQTLDKYETRLNLMEKEREKAYGSISQTLLAMGKTQNLLHLETANLVKALRLPHVRGRWGEMTLRRVAELSGMSRYCDFVEQLSSGNKKGALRPDMVVMLPEGRKVVIDAKVPLMAYLDALEASGDQERQDRMKDHGRQVMNHILNLSSKGYMNQFTPTPEFVVLFIPGENFFSAALSVYPDMIEKGIEKGVILATPATLIALLKAVSYSWKQNKSWENAEVIRSLGVELFARLCRMTGHINRLGKDIERCAADYNRTVGAMETRVMTSARKLADLEISSLELENLSKIDTSQTRVKSFNEQRSNEIQPDEKNN